MLARLPPVGNMHLNLVGTGCLFDEIYSFQNTMHQVLLIRFQGCHLDQGGYRKLSKILPGART